MTTTSPALVALASAIGALGLCGALLAMSGRIGSTTRLESKVPSLDKGALAISVACAAVIAVTTHLVVATIAAAIGGYLLPKLLGASPTMKLAEKREGLVEWVFALRDLLRGGAGLAQAIVASGEDPPETIATEIAVLVAQAKSGSIEPALRQLSVDIADPLADRVIGALILASKYRGEKLAELLDSLGRSAAEEIKMLRTIDTDREQPRGEMRFIIGFTAAFAFLAFTVAHAYMAPYSSAVGEVVLAAILTAYAAGAWLMAHWCQPPPAVRLDLSRYSNVIAPLPTLEGDRAMRTGLRTSGVSP